MSRADGLQDEDRAQLAGLLGDPAPGGDDVVLRMRYGSGRRRAEDAFTPGEDLQRLFTEVCLHGLARLCDDVDALDTYLPPHMAAMARKVADALQVPEPATT